MRFEFHPGVYTIQLTYHDWYAVLECLKHSFARNDAEAAVLEAIELWAEAVHQEEAADPRERVEFVLPSSWFLLLVRQLMETPGPDGYGYEELLLPLYGQLAAQNRRRR